MLDLKVILYIKIRLGLLRIEENSVLLYLRTPKGKGVYVYCLKRLAKFTVCVMTRKYIKLTKQ